MMITVFNLFAFGVPTRDSGYWAATGVGAGRVGPQGAALVRGKRLAPAGGFPPLSRVAKPLN